MLIRRYLIALSLFIVFLVAACRWQNAMETPQSVHRRDTQKMRHRAAQLLEKLGPQAAGLELMVFEPVGCAANCRGHRRISSVYAVNRTGTIRATLFINIDTGDLVRLSLLVPEDEVYEGSIDTPEEAVKKGHDWLAALGSAKFVAGGEAKSVRRAANTWYISWQSKRYRTTMRLDERNGNLKIINHYRLSQVPLCPASPVPPLSADRNRMPRRG